MPGAHYTHGNDYQPLAQRDRTKAGSSIDLRPVACAGRGRQCGRGEHERFTLQEVLHWASGTDASITVWVLWVFKYLKRGVGGSRFAVRLVRWCVVQERRRSGSSMVGITFGV